MAYTFLRTLAFVTAISLLISLVDGFTAGVAPSFAAHGLHQHQQSSSIKQRLPQQHLHVYRFSTPSSLRATPSIDENNDSPSSDFFSSLLDRFQGDFDNYRQVVQDRQDGLLPREGGGHEQIHCLLLPVVVASNTENDNGGRRAARLAAFYFDGIPQRIFRFRYYELTENPVTSGATTKVDMKLYCLNGALEGQMRGMEDPLDWPAAFEKFATSSDDDKETVTLLEKCDVQWSRDLDEVQHAYALARNEELLEEQHQTNNDNTDNTPLAPLTDPGIHAIMTYGEATVDSTMMPGSKIRIMDQLSLWEAQFWIHDRGFNPDTGDFIYGNQRGVPYQLDRVANIITTDDGGCSSEVDSGSRTLIRQVVNESVQWTLGPLWRTEEEYQSKLDAVGGGVSSQLNQPKKVGK